MFSINAVWSSLSSLTSETWTGSFSRPAICAARQRRSPATISKRSPLRRTTMGCTRPALLIDSANSCSLTSSKRVLGCSGLGSSRSRSTSRCGCLASTTGTGAESGGARVLGIQALSPRPSAGRRSDFCATAYQAFAGAARRGAAPLRDRSSWERAT